MSSRTKKRKRGGRKHKKKARSENQDTGSVEKIAVQGQSKFTLAKPKLLVTTHDRNTAENTGLTDQTRGSPRTKAQIFTDLVSKFLDSKDNSG